MSGHGTIEDRGKSYRLRYRVGGKTQTESFPKSAGKRAAEARLRELQTAVDHGAKSAPSRETCAAYFERWLAALPIGDGEDDLSPMSLKLYRARVNGHLIPLFGAVRLRELDRATIRAGWAKLDHLARSTRNTTHRVLSAALGQAVEDGLLHTNPAAGWTKNKRTAAKAAARERPEQAILTPAETVRLVELVADSFMFAPVVLGLATGARRGEIAALRWDRINLDNGDVAIVEALKEITAGDIRSGPPKTGKPRTVKLPARYLDMLRRWKRLQAEQLLARGIRQTADTPVCTRPNGRRLSPNQITDLFTTIATKQLGRPDVHFHSLRHSHASILIAAGEAIPAVSKRLGHGDVSTTMRVYTHAIPVADDSAEADRLDALLG